jgi:hypothetical protein
MQESGISVKKAIETGIETTWKQGFLADVWQSYAVFTIDANSLPESH